MNYKLSDFNKTSVYLLKKDGVVVYVGSSKNGFYRALSHAYNKPVKDFDEIELIDCELDDLIELETELIIKYQPIYNNTIPSKNYITLKSGEAIPEITTKNTTEEYILSPSLFSDDDIYQLDEKDKDTNIIEKVPYQKIVDAYNDICVSMPSVKAITSKRKEKMKVLFREVKDLDVIEECFRKAENSSFLNGSSGKWSGCNFDWLVNYNNFIKVIEGTYDELYNLFK